MKQRDSWQMKVGCLIVATAILGSFSPGIAASSGSDGLLRMKAGTFTFKLLDSRGVKPLAGSNLSLASVKDGKSVVSSTADKTGKCSLNVAKGRYILKVDDLNLTIVEFAAESKITECRIVVPDMEMQVGGGEAAAAALGKTMGWGTFKGIFTGAVPLVGMTPVVIGTTVFLVGGGGYWIYHEVKDDGDGKKSTSTSTATSP